MIKMPVILNQRSRKTWRACVALPIDAFYTSNLPPWFGASNWTKVTHLVDEQNPTKLESIEITMGCNHENSSSNTISQPYQIFEKPRVLFWSYGIKKSWGYASPVQWKVLMRSIRSCPLAWLSSPSWLGIFGACWKVGPAVGVNEPSTNPGNPIYLEPRCQETRHLVPKYIGKWKMRGKNSQNEGKLVLKFWRVDILKANKDSGRNRCLWGLHASLVAWWHGW